MTARTPRFTDYTGESTPVTGNSYMIWVKLHSQTDSVPLMGDLPSMEASKKLFKLRKAHPEHSYEMIKK